MAAAERALQTELEQAAADFPGTLGVAVKDLDSGDEAGIAAGERFPAASLIKVAVMVEVFHQLAAGALRRDTTIVLRDGERAGDEPGPLDAIADGAALGVLELVAAMITASDNTATNLLLRRVGTAAVNERMAACGLASTRIFRPAFRDGHADVDPDLEREHGLGTTTPAEMARLFELLARGELVDAAASAEMLAILRRQRDRSMIPRELPLGRDAIRVSNKTGWDREKRPDGTGFLGEVRTDAAYVEGSGLRYVIAICGRRGRDPSPGADNRALLAGARISRQVHDLLAARRR